MKTSNLSARTNWFLKSFRVIRKQEVPSITFLAGLTRSTMKSMASAILGSTGPLAKFPNTIFFSMKAGINQKLWRGRGEREEKP